MSLLFPFLTLLVLLERFILELNPDYKLLIVAHNKTNVIHLCMQINFFPLSKPRRMLIRSIITSARDVIYVFLVFF